MAVELREFSNLAYQNYISLCAMVSIVVDHLSEIFKTRSVGIAYFYFDYQEQEIQTPTYFVASLLRQLAVRTTDFPRPLQELYERYKIEPLGSIATELITVLKQVRTDFDTCFLIPDALDESNGKQHRGEILQIMKDLEQVGFRILITSRPHPHDIKRYLEKAAQISIEASEADLRMFCTCMIDANDNISDLLDDALREDVLSVISRNAQGMFLLPVLQIQTILDQMTKSEIKKCLRGLSANLNQVFKDPITRMSNETRNRQQVAIQTLMWIRYACRPLHVDELRHALATQLGDTNFDRDNLLPSRSMIESCLGLVVLDDESSTVRLVHYTLQEYLKSIEQKLFPNGQDYITNICLTYLYLDSVLQDTTPEIEQIQTMLQNFPFLQYAITRWGHHAREATNSDHESGLLIAADFGLDSIVGLLLDKGIEVDSKDANNNTALHKAASRGYFSTAECLLQGGAQVDAQNLEDNTALYLASSTTHSELISLLLRYKANPNLPCADKWTPLHKAVDIGHYKIVELLLKYNASILAKTEKGLVALHRAAGRGHIGIIRLLLAKGSLIEVTTWDGWTPLAGPSSNGQLEVVELLLQHGAKVNSTCSNRRTPLHRACRGGHLQTVMYLLKNGANVLAKDYNGQIPMHRATKGGFEDIVKVLLGQDPCPQLKCMDGCGQTARGGAFAAGFWKVGRMLRNEEFFWLGGQYEKLDELVIAIEEHDAVKVQDLIEKGFDINRRDADGLAPLHQAFQTSTPNIARIILQNGADIEAETTDGWRPIHCAAKRGFEVCLKLCLEYGANIIAQTGEGETALHKASKSGNAGVARILIEKGAKIEASDSWGYRPLHSAASAGNENILRLLMEYHVNIWAIDNDQRTAQTCAAEAGHYDLVEFIWEVWGSE